MGCEVSTSFEDSRLVPLACLLDMLASACCGMVEGGFGGFVMVPSLLVSSACPSLGLSCSWTMGFATSIADALAFDIAFVVVFRPFDAAWSCRSLRFDAACLSRSLAFATSASLRFSILSFKSISYCLLAAFVLSSRSSRSLRACCLISSE